MPMKAVAADLRAVESFKALFETAPDGMLVVDAAGRIVLANPQAERLFGFHAEELAGQHVELLLPESVRARHLQHRRDFADAPRTRPMGAGLELSARRKNGSEFPVEIALSPMNLDAGPFVVASVRDITETRRAQQAMKRARYSEQLAKLGELALASADVDALLAAIPRRVAETLDIDIVIVYLLDGSRRRFLCKGAHGLDADEVLQLHEENSPTSQPGFVLATGDTVVVEDYATETRFRINPVMHARGMRSGIGVPLSDGRERIGTLTARASRPNRFGTDESNFLKSVGTIVAAALDRLHTEERLQHAERLESIGQLTGGIAHDFNNLLTVISGNLQMLEDGLADQPDLLRAVSAAMRATGRGADLTRKLLAFSRRQALRPQAVRLEEHLPTLVELLTRTLGARIQISTHAAPDTPPCRVDPSQLDNAILNLALNARDAMPDGGALTIDVGPVELDSEYSQRHPDVRPGRYVALSVTDTGEGMPAEVLAHAFEPFFTTKPPGKGSGLGLAMVYGFVKQSGGHLSVYSEPGLGTTMRLYLPPAEAEASSREPALAPRRGAGECVLVVEDDADVRDLARAFLTQAHYQVVEVASAEDAMAVLDREPVVDLLFSDVVLAGPMTGPALADAALAKRPELRVLLTTGYARGGLPLAAHVDRFPLLRKPYRREDLVAAIRACLDQADPGVRTPPLDPPHKNPK